jgi:hypothetical protein
VCYDAAPFQGYYIDNAASVVFMQLRESPYKIIVYFYEIVPLYLTQGSKIQTRSILKLEALK